MDITSIRPLGRGRRIDAVAAPVTTSPTHARPTATPQTHSAAQLVEHPDADVGGELHRERGHRHVDR